MKFKYIVISLIAMAVTFAIGFVVGKGNRDIVTRNVVIEKPVPVKEISPSDTLDIVAYAIREGLVPVKWKRDTVRIVDTIAVKDNIVRDWGTQRLYKENLVGGIAVTATVQYNRLSDVVVTAPSLKKRIEPYVATTLMTSGDIGVNAGVYLKNGLAVGAVYQRNLVDKRNAYGVSIGYKF